jgi:hypothetical protein
VDSAIIEKCNVNEIIHPKKSFLKWSFAREEESEFREKFIINISLLVKKASQSIPLLQFPQRELQCLKYKYFLPEKRGQ